MSVFHQFICDYPNENDFGLDEFFVKDSEGYASILNPMIRKIKEKGAKFELNTKVKKISYNDDKCMVET